MTDNNKHQNKTEALNEEERKTELSMEELEQVSGGKDPNARVPKPPIYGCPFYNYIELDSSGKCTSYSSTNCPGWCGLGYGTLENDEVPDDGK